VGTLTTSSSSPSNPTLTVPLSGTGIGTGIGPVPSLAPSSLSFGNVLAGTISPPQTATLTNVRNSSSLQFHLWPKSVDIFHQDFAGDLGLGN
jgi:hypothetical protein